MTMNRDMDFFEQLTKFEAESSGFKSPVPICYYDLSALAVTFTADAEEVRKWLPSPRLKPYQILPKRAVVVFSAFSYRDTDIGPYNEFAVAVPVAMDVPRLAPGLSLIKGIAHPSAYIVHLPVTTEIAFRLGKDFYNFPKFVAEIDFEQNERELSVRLAEGGKFILSLTVPLLKGRMSFRQAINVLSSRSDRILRSETIVDAKEVAMGSFRGIKYDLGEDHFMARDIKAMKLGRPMGAFYIAKAQMILTNPLESFKIQK